MVKNAVEQATVALGEQRQKEIFECRTSFGLPEIILKLFVLNIKIVQYLKFTYLPRVLSSPEGQGST